MKASTQSKPRAVEHFDLKRFAEINAKYALEMDFDSVSRLCERFGLTFPKL